MTEPTFAALAIAAAAAAAAAATASTLVPGIDGDALVGAVAGGALFVTNARDLPMLSRLVYLLSSTGAGYVAAPELLRHVPLQGTGVAAFIGGALVVTVTTRVLERLKTADLASLFTKRGA